MDSVIRSTAECEGAEVDAACTWLMRWKFTTWFESKAEYRKVVPHVWKKRNEKPTLRTEVNDESVT